MAGLGGLFGEGSLASQFLLWGVAYNLAQSLMRPALADIEQAVWSTDPSQVLSPDQLADQVVRNITDMGNATTEAAKSGIGPGRFRSLVDGAGEPPGLEFLLQAFRRGFIPWGPGHPGVPTVETGIQTSRIYDYWTETIQQMKDVPIPPADAVNAVLRGQIPLEQGQNEAFASGIDADRFRILLDSAGRPPSPGELITLLRRRLIPESGTGPQALSFQQGIFEGDTKDKWWQLFAALAEYRPPPRTVTALLRSGSIDDQEALRLLQDEGLTPQLAAAYVHNAKGEKLAGSKHLAQGTVLTLYEAQAIDQATALADLTTLGYGNTEALLLLDVADLQREVKALNSAISRVGTYYVAHKLTRTGAQNSLHALGVTGAHAQHLMATWDAEAAANVRTLSEAQIARAVKLGNMTQVEAMTELVAIGLTPFDAWVVISNELGGPQPNKPARGPAQPGTT